VPVMAQINLLNPVDASECSGCGVSDFCHSLWSISHDFLLMRTLLASFTGTIIFLNGKWRNTLAVNAYC